MTTADIQKVAQLLAEPKKIAIIPHRSPDGDAMGSTLALYHFLQKTGHQAVVVSPNEFPDFLAWMPGSDQVLIYENKKDQVAKILHESELIFTLDFNALHRTGEMEKILTQLQVPMIMIDHHQSPENYARVTFSDTQYGSTCEMVYHFLNYLGQKAAIDLDIATCIYTGILTDSGSFRFPKTTGNTHRIVAELIDLGVNNTQIPSLLFDNNSYESRQLLGRALRNLVVLPEFETAYTSLSQAELDEFHYVKGDTEGIVNYGLSIKGIRLAAIFIEHKDENIIKISLRSQGNLDVNQLAREHFNGGGHINAAGGKSSLSLAQTIEKFKKVITQIPAL